MPLARALVARWHPVLEVTLRAPVHSVHARHRRRSARGAARRRHRAERRRPDAAAKAGAVSRSAPSACRRFQAARTSPIPFLPAVLTLRRDHRDGRRLRHLQLFPAARGRRLAMLKAMAALSRRPASAPPAAIDAASAPAFLALPNVACVGGSWLCPAELVRAGDWDAITALARAAAGSCVRPPRYGPKPRTLPHPPRCPPPPHQVHQDPVPAGPGQCQPATIRALVGPAPTCSAQLQPRQPRSSTARVPP